ncbi:hypothetical protein [Hydrogenovibrio marinus]|uniref:Uncharacterized protein n=1 Tax=Hydrogenovibrio marinus TaxID=28885 RepID=A0A067A1M4_HYDMR|nr:hypothetical protein [Hydrogenovibrio marinus]KDN96521.1 hypothetical protein EI16_09685 [Hydrogenovibrio marinus]BBN60275.1 hypothetical protein HVMH_1869 [Hydrogenovibrio marinus]
MPTKQHYESFESLGRDALDRITEINLRLESLSELIKKSQPKKPGAITLHLYSCGKDCLGCPHPSWLVWYSTKKGDDSVFLSYKTKTPLRKVKRSGDFKESSEKTKRLIKEAIELLQERSEIINMVSNLNKKLSAMGKVRKLKIIA